MTCDAGKFFVKNEGLSGRFNFPEIGDLGKDVAVVIYPVLLISFVGNFFHTFPKNFPELLYFLWLGNSFQLNETLLPKLFFFLLSNLIKMLLHDDMIEVNDQVSDI